MLMIYSISFAHVPLNGSFLYRQIITFTPLNKSGTSFFPIQWKHAVFSSILNNIAPFFMTESYFDCLKSELRGKGSGPEQSSFLTIHHHHYCHHHRHHHNLSCLPTISLGIKELWCRLVLTLFSLCLRLQNQTRTTSFSKWSPSAIRTISCDDGLLFSTKFLSSASFAPRLRKWIKNTFLLNIVLTWWKSKRSQRFTCTCIVPDGSSSLPFAFLKSHFVIKQCCGEKWKVDRQCTWAWFLIFYKLPFDNSCHHMCLDISLADILTNF